MGEFEGILNAINTVGLPIVMLIYFAWDSQKERKKNYEANQLWNTTINKLSNELEKIARK